MNIMEAWDNGILLRTVKRTVKELQPIPARGSAEALHFFFDKKSTWNSWGSCAAAPPQKARGLQKADHVVEGAVQIFADALQSQKGEIFILLQAVQGLMLHNAVSQQLILGDTFFFHS